jgi:CheY-like chemotaxis protein
MDSQMPIMDGFEATIKIRKSEKGTSNHIPIIAVTAHSTIANKEKCLSFGMDDYLNKPTRQEHLAHRIAFWLNKNDPDSLSAKLFESQNIDSNDPSHLSELECIDLRLNELSESCSPEVVLDCINLFLTDTEYLINALKGSIKKSNFKRIARDAHKLKGSSSNMGAKGMPLLCQKLIALANYQQTSASKIFLNKIIDEHDFLKSIYSEKKVTIKKLPENKMSVI